VFHFYVFAIVSARYWLVGRVLQERESASGQFSEALTFPVTPPGCNSRKHQADKNDYGGDLDPKKAAEFSKNDFNAIAPRGRQSIANGLMPCVAVRRPHLIQSGL
jgi:hypothetical protein